METPTATEIRERSPLLRERYGATPGVNEPDLLAAVEDTSVLVARATCRQIDPWTEGTDVPEGLVGIAVRAIAKWAERIDAMSIAAQASASATGKGNLRSISAGPWSESYFGPGELVLKNGIVSITGDPILDALLWALMTDDCRECWLALATGVPAPYGVVTPFDYRKMGGATGGTWQTLGSGPDGW